MANRWWTLTALGAVILTMAALLLLQTRPQVRTAAPADPAVDAGARCPDADLPPAPVLARLEAAPLLLVGDGAVRFFVDGAAAFSPAGEPHRFPAGLRKVRGEASGAEQAELVLRLEAFRPGLVLGFVSGPAVVLLPVEAPCDSCPLSDTPLELGFDGSSREDELAAAARALAQGDWRTAVPALRGVPPRERTEHFTALRAVAEALSGRASHARALLDGLPGEAGKRWKTAARALADLAPAEKAQEAQVAMQRWNVITERYNGLADAFGVDAPGPVGRANSRFNELSLGFQRAGRAGDVIEQEATTQAALEVLVALVRELRHLRPGDCAWQARVTTTQ